LEIERFREDDQQVIPTTLDYHGMSGLSMELRQKLSRVRPATLGQATRVEGMTPAALACVLSSIRKPVRRST
ncbi:MAG: tRNA uridine-5-carboxymethylaminomethyl(34) synthesis enzyme MnmG, partial [Phyllobacteriaceae bacterium]|nr:tRNA uridine-5-carboxymethylaminomethyl(34) synthesis enzyme MnmG [Phyllobacteriaceae bacterium]